MNVFDVRHNVSDVYRIIFDPDTNFHREDIKNPTQNNIRHQLFDYAYKEKGFSVHNTQNAVQCSGSQHNKLFHSSSLSIHTDTHLNFLL